MDRRLIVISSRTLAFVEIVFANLIALCHLGMLWERTV
jgi:hypothetical protein